MIGKKIFGKRCQMTQRIPRGSTFCQNCSITHCLQDKRVFAFYAEIQDGRPKWREKLFLTKSARLLWRYLWVKNFVKITLSCKIPQIIAFLHFTQKFKMAGKTGGKIIFSRKCQRTLYILYISSKLFDLTTFLGY